MKKTPTKLPRPRNPFYKELRQLGVKVLKNKKKYDRKRGKKLKIMSGLHTNIYTPPSGPRAPTLAKSLFLNVFSIIHNIYYNIPQTGRF